MRKLITGTFIVVLVGISFTGCEPKKNGPMEKAGERIDEIADNVKDGDPPLHKKGTMEKLGEDIDNATGANENH